MTNRAHGEGETADGAKGELQRLRERLAEAEATRDKYASILNASGAGILEERLDQQSYELGERVKELRCMYDVSRILLGATSHHLDEVLERIIERIPAGWQYPEITGARIRLGDVERQSPDFKATRWMQRREFELAEGVDGCIEVVYLEAPPDGSEPVFLEEEDHLLEAISSRLVEAGRRAQAEERVRFQATLLAAVGEAVIATDLEGRVTYWNRSAEQLYGWSAAETLGRDILELTPSDEARAAADEILACLTKGESWSGEFEMRRKDGTTFPAQVTDSPIFDDVGEVIGVVGITRDLTERKQIEAQFRQAQKLEAVGRLAGGIAHDFNNMLTAIQGNTQLLEQDVAADEGSLESVREIEQAAGRAASLTRQLLAFSRQQVLQPKVLSTREVVGAIEPMLDRLLGECVELRVRSVAGLGSIRADRGQLTQVVMNLVINAGEAMPSGGEINIELENVDVTTAKIGRPDEVPPGRYVTLSVRDTGTGIDDELLANIFEPFFTTKSDGSGLGLSTVYGIVKQSGGHLNVQSEPGRGAAFCVYLPRVEEPGPTESNEARSLQPARAPEERTILVCEDALPVRRMARRALTRQGYRVLEAPNGEAALEMLERADESVDLVLSDVVMPGLGGLELAEELRERWPEVKVLLMSGYPSRDVLDANDLEFEMPFLPKPFSFAELCTKVAELLDGRHGS